MTIPFEKTDPNEALAVNHYMNRLNDMSDQLRIAEQRLSMKIDQEINHAYQAHQNAISTSVSFMYTLERFNSH